MTHSLQRFAGGIIGLAMTLVMLVALPTNLI